MFDSLHVETELNSHSFNEMVAMHWNKFGDCAPEQQLAFCCRADHKSEGKAAAVSRIECVL